MDIQPQETTLQPISDDQELAKALAGIADEPEVATPVVGTPAPVASAPTPVTPVVAPLTPPVVTPLPQPGVVAPVALSLDDVKKDALQELRPLIDHVDLAPEEKFDIYLMLIRSTDDTTLIAPAHAAAQSIADEKRKAEALLDIIKEIDFLSHKDQPAV